jgi:hypothetical protein
MFAQGLEQGVDELGCMTLIRSEQVLMKGVEQLQRHPRNRPTDLCICRYISDPSGQHKPAWGQRSAAAEKMALQSTRL